MMEAVDKTADTLKSTGYAVFHPKKTVKEVATTIKSVAEEKGGSYVGGYVLGEAAQAAALAGAGVAGAATKGTKITKTTKKNKYPIADTTKESTKNITKKVDTIEGGSKKIDNIISNLTETTNGKGVARNFESTGGFDQTIKDFDSLNPVNVKEIQTQYGAGKVGKLSNGTTVVARPGSTTGGATLEIRVSNNKVYKIRY